MLRKSVFTITALSLIMITIFAVIQAPQSISQPLEGLTLETDLPHLIKAGNPIIFNVYLVNNKPYHYTIENEFLAHVIVLESNTGSIIMELQQTLLRNETINMDPYDTKYLGEITYSPKPPGKHIIHLNYGKIRSHIYVSIVGNRVTDTWYEIPEGLTNLNRMRKRNITVFLEEYVVSSGTPLEIFVSNEGRTEVITGIEYGIETYVDEKWITYQPTKPDGSGFILIGKYVRPNSVFLQSIDISHLKPGYYRIVKSVVFGTQDVLDYYCEFQIIE